ncbi:NUDIX hydrolase [Nocardioides plantarum]|uniref:NUDIX domain-containing protein n=1 Tax=Nocardioides plantarum TaxID=29299 RepID=A0ABV5K6C1_9ACTN|nr:NUDIX hydrolase [Nocardioides plantarum]
MPAPAAKAVRAAGVVVFRPGRRVLLVHRPKYDDWSFPKGKLDPGEHATTAAVREVAEETGLHVRLCLPLHDQAYRVLAGHKTVHYWTGRVVGDDDVSRYRANDEIDAVRWVDLDEAADLLTYDHDSATLAEALGRRRRTHALVVLRHGRARSRSAWRRDDTERPLLRAGELQAERLVPVLAAYGVTQLVSSTSLRCRQTLAPFAGMTGWDLVTRRRLSEEGASPAGVRRVVTDTLALVAEGRSTVVCTHRPVLPEVFAALGLEDPGLDPGEMLVAHLRKGRVAGTERHLVR